MYGPYRTSFVYDEAGHLIGEYNGAGTLIQETIWLDDIPVATIRPNGTGGVNIFYVHTDHLSTPRVITDASNQIRWRWDRDPFGTKPANQNPSGLGVFTYNLRFPGQYYDSETGLHYNYFRDYDPATGRYLQSDPLLQPTRALGDGWALYVSAIRRTPEWFQPYSYVVSDPTSNADPLGLGMLDVIRCVWMGEKLQRFNKECRSQCPSDDVMRQLQFMQDYKAVSVSDALLTCTCAKAAQAGERDLCANWVGRCVKGGIGKPPRP